MHKKGGKRVYTDTTITTPISTPLSPKNISSHTPSNPYTVLPISFLTQFSNPPSAIISCTLGGNSPTLTLH